MEGLLGGAFLGWALGANDAANVFGTAVASRAVSFRRAAIICSIFVILGAVLEGENGIRTISSLTEQSIRTLSITSLAAAITITMMILLKLPTSTSQAIIGAITGIGLATGYINWQGLQKVVICWVATPVGAMIFSCILYLSLGQILNSIPMSILTRDKLLWGGLLLVGTYGSYSLGANNVANVIGIFSGKVGLTDRELAFLGSLAIASGILTLSSRMMKRIGSDIMRLDAFTAFIAVASMATVVHIFAKVGVPVSTSQGIIGAIIGLGLMKGVHALNYKVIGNILAAWIVAPLVAIILASSFYAIFCLPKP